LRVKSDQFVPKFSHLVIVRAPHLLNMYYPAPALEQELGLPARTLREWANRGMPHRRDERGHIFIHGKDFEIWVEHTRRNQRRPLADDEAFCLKCKGPVIIEQPRRIQHPSGAHLLAGKCPACGTTVNRGVKSDSVR
jgi:hypothetical protein